MSDLVKRLREGIEQDQHGPYIFSAESLMDEAADRIEHLERVLMEVESALELIATPKRPDGTWNRDREACRDLAEKTLAQINPQTIGTSDAS